MTLEEIKRDREFIELTPKQVNWLIEEVERLQKLAYTEKGFEYRDCLDQCEAELTELKDEVERLQLIVSGKTFYDVEKATAQRCAEIANDFCRDSSGYNTGCDTEDQIRKEFRL